MARRRGLIVVVVLGLAAASSGGALTPRAAAARGCVVPGAREPLERIWRPDTAAASSYARRRTGDIAFAVRTDRRFWGYRPDHVEWSASVVKAMLMVAYLRRASVRDRLLNGYDRSLLVPMITHSDNNAATTVDGIVGNAGLAALAARVGMTHFAPVAQPWGETRITARDQTLFFLHIDRYVPPLHRGFAMRLLASITPSQRWGIGEVAPRGWHLYFKGGWGSGTGLLDHQVVLLKRGCARVSLAVLSMYDGSHAYGKATLRGMFARLLGGFPTGDPLYPVVRSEVYRGTVSGGAGTVTFRTGHGGQDLFGLTVAVQRCAGATYRFRTLLVDPYGRFRAQAAGAGSTLTISGRFLAHRQAGGTVVQQVAAAPGAGVCRATLAWRAAAR